MKDQDLVSQFMKRMGQQCGIGSLSDDKLKTFRLNLICEEFNEFKEALQENDLYGIKKELSDLLYVIYGFGVTFGIDLHETLKKVHYSNMSKLDNDGNPIKDENGKVLKGPNYRKPDLD